MHAHSKSTLLQFSPMSNAFSQEFRTTNGCLWSIFFLNVVLQAPKPKQFPHIQHHALRSIGRLSWKPTKQCNANGKKWKNRRLTSIAGTFNDLGSFNTVGVVFLPDIFSQDLSSVKCSSSQSQNYFPHVEGPVLQCRLDEQNSFHDGHILDFSSPPCITLNRFM